MAISWRRRQFFTQGRPRVTRFVKTFRNPQASAPALPPTAGTLGDMAGYGHIALGAAVGRILGDSLRRRPWPYVVGGVALAWLPDVDLVWVLLGVRDHGLQGHRGFTHTPFFALVVGVVATLVLRLSARSVRDSLRLGLLAAALVGSHPILDALAQDGRGMMSLWPFSLARYHFLWRPIPDAPIGLKFFTRVGLSHLAIELMYFSPLTLIALRRAATGRRLTPSESAAPVRGVVARLRARVPRPVWLLRARPE
jgi:inner membrane protein